MPVKITKEAAAPDGPTCQLGLGYTLSVLLGG
jgi:hypothetical protein